MGLADDGGLLIPKCIPDVASELPRWRRLGYTDLAFVIMRLFSDLPDQALRELIARSYSTFRAPEITPVVQVGDRYVLELFHGPTMAFKDVALQFLGNLFEYDLQLSGGGLNIVGATSGDTGSAAIYGVCGKSRITIFILHPHGKVSPIQERQMTSVLDANVFNIAVDGTFDDCQGIVKDLFNDLQFKRELSLGAVNSINWARILAQIVYYFYGVFRVMDSTGALGVRVAVPTGNFGDVFAGYIAARMGLPVSKLVLATNENDILSRFFNSGVYSKAPVVSTVSPSMDIQIASNFERYLYYQCNCDSKRLRALMTEFSISGRLEMPKGQGPSDDLIVAGSAGTADVFATIRDYYQRNRYLLDPHTAVGVSVSSRFMSKTEPMLCLATAHPAKFGETITKALGQDLAHHPILDELRTRPTRCKILSANTAAVREYVSAHAVRRPTGV